MKYLFLIFIVLFFGCSQKSYIYIDEPKVSLVKKKDISLGLKEISLPYYLDDAKIPYVKDSKVKFFKDSEFSLDASEFATKRAMDILRASLTSRVYEYPFSKGAIKYILEIEIRKFITVKNTVELKAFWRVFDKNKKLIRSSTYHDSILLKNITAQECAKGMQILFDRFIKNIARKLSEI